MSDEQVIEQAKLLAKNRFFAKNFGVDARFFEPDVFEKTLGFFKWAKKNELTPEQKALYMSTYREHFNRC
jgi:hypothetical protein